MHPRPAIGRDSTAEAARRERRKFINKLREPIIILSNSAASGELINYDKVTRKRDREGEGEKWRTRRTEGDGEYSLCPDRAHRWEKFHSIFRRE